MKRLNFGLAAAVLMGTCGLLSTATAFDNAGPAAKERGRTTPSVRITDPKLGVINYAADSLEFWLGKMKAGDVHRARSLERDLAKLVVRFKRVPRADSEQYRFVAARIDRLAAEIGAKNKVVTAPPKPTVATTPLINATAGGRAGLTLGMPASAASRPAPQSPEHDLPRPHRNLYSLLSRIDGLEDDVQKRRQGETIARVKSRYENIAKYFASIPASRHPDYIRVQTRLQNIDRFIARRSPKLNMTREQMDEFLAMIERKYGVRGDLRPSTGSMMLKNRELTAAEIDQFLSRVKSLGEHIGRDLETLRKIYLLTGDGERWIDWMTTGSVEELRKQMEALVARINGEVTGALRDAQAKSRLDPKKSPHAFRGQARKRNVEDYARASRTLEQAARLAAAMGLESPWDRQKQELDGYIAAYNKKASGAAAGVEFPREVGNSELRQVAEEVLKRKKYGVGPWVRLIVNSQPRDLDRTEVKQFNGKLERIVREWQEFQVTTIEPENGKYYLYYNNIAKFSRAPRTTPVNVWILKQRFKGVEVSADSVK